MIFIENFSSDQKKMIQQIIHCENDQKIIQKMILFQNHEKDNFDPKSFYKKRYL